jgi:hypothetical protein
MLKKTLSTILIVTAAMLAMPAVIFAQDAPVDLSKKAATAKTVKSGRIDVDGIQYHYQVRGQGAPLLLLHGGLGSTDMFAPIMPVLGAKRQIIAVDLQGHGRTPLREGWFLSGDDRGAGTAQRQDGGGHERHADVQILCSGGTHGRRLSQAARCDGRHDEEAL